MEIQSVERDITERVHAEESVLQSERFMRATIDALSAHICVIDELGTVVSVNKGWCDFAAANPPEMENSGIGANYLTVCDAAFGDDKEQARQFARGIRSVLGGDSDLYSQEYPCHSQNERRWFLGRVTRFLTGTDLVRVVIAHENITERKLAEQSLDNVLDELENLVQERTKSLTLSNQQLHQEIEERKRIEQEILDHQQKLQIMARELIMAEERERNRIAGELHDQVGQRLILGKMKLDALVSRMPSEQCESDVEAVRTVLDQSIQDIRSLTFQIRPPVLASAGLEAAIQWLSEEFKEDFGLRIEFSDDSQPKPMGYEVRSTIFQVVRELLLNVTKHADTKRVMIRMKRKDDTIVITITDNGIGFDTMEVSKRSGRKGGYGLFNIHQRIDCLGGNLVLESVPGSGTCATITVPLEESTISGSK